jgi:tetratricopeptide (TPR) repeat protein
LASSSHEADPPDRDDDLIAPADVRLSAGSGEREALPGGSGSGSGSGSGRRGAFAALALLVIGALILFFLLPASDPPPAQPDPSDADERLEPVPEPSTRRRETDTAPPPFERLRLQQERDRAQQILERLVGLTDSLEARAVERWGEAGMARARSLAEEGDALFLERDYEAAQDRYREAVAELETLDARAEALADERIEAGRAALAEGASQAATEAFDLALAIRPDSEPAQTGLERAEVLDRVLEQVREARRLARDGELETARTRLNEALELDSRSPPARAALAEVEAALTERRFTETMSAGYRALREQRFDAAREQFRAAGELGPDATGVETALELVESEARDHRIEQLRSEAARLEESEQWARAADVHAEALELDPTLAFASRGREQSRSRSELDTRLEETLAHPERLNDDAALGNARALLARAQEAEPRGPRLTRQLEELTELVRVAAVPVSVTLVSDGRTRVHLLQVAQLGSFEQHSLELRPGAYVAVGSRIGFRDVRVEFVVTPDGTDGPVRIQCEKRI